jgi:hypothetical protein
VTRKLLSREDAQRLRRLSRDAAFFCSIHLVNSVLLFRWAVRWRVPQWEKSLLGKESVSLRGRVRPRFRVRIEIVHAKGLLAREKVAYALVDVQFAFAAVLVRPITVKLDSIKWG